MKTLRLFLFLLLPWLVHGQAVKEVANIAALRNERVNPWQLDRIVIVNGYWSANDGGGGKFAFSEGPAAGGTNVCVVFKTLNTNTLVVIPDGYWYPIDLRQPVDIRRAGATAATSASASTRNSAAIQYLVDGGYEPFVPIGVFGLASPIRLGAGNSISGSGRHSSLRSIHTGPLLVVTNATPGVDSASIVIENLSLAAATGVSGSAALIMTNAVDTLIRNVKFFGSPVGDIGTLANLVEIHGKTPGAPYNLWFDHCLFSGGQATNVVLSTKEGGIASTYFAECYFYSANQHLIGEDNEAPYSLMPSINLFSCVLEGSAKEAIQLYSLWSGNIRNTRFEQGGVTNSIIKITERAASCIFDALQLAGSGATDAGIELAANNHMVFSAIRATGLDRAVILFNVGSQDPTIDNVWCSGVPDFLSPYAMASGIWHHGTNTVQFTTGSAAEAAGYTNIFAVDGSIRVRRGSTDLTNFTAMDLRLNDSRLVLAGVNQSGSTTLPTLFLGPLGSAGAVTADSAHMTNGLRAGTLGVGSAPSTAVTAKFLGGLVSNPVGSGGTITTYTNSGTVYKVHTFTSSGSFTNSSGASVVDVLAIGGAGGGASVGGGGGAGGVVWSPGYSLAPGASVTVTVGSGGGGGQAWQEAGTNGTDSVFGSLTAVGGGAGLRLGNGNLGGSGGGGGYSYVGGAGTADQGYAGGAGFNDGAQLPGGGGGGAGGIGADAAGGNGGNGGIGVTNSITGTATPYASGGGGGTFSATAGTASPGGGGDGGTGATPGVDGTANTGGGGGGSGGTSIAGDGGSGVVIVRYVFSGTLPQLSLDYDASNQTTFQTDSGGNLTIAPSGGTVTNTGKLVVTDSLLPKNVTASRLARYDAEGYLTNATTDIQAWLTEAVASGLYQQTNAALTLLANGTSAYVASVTGTNGGNFGTVTISTNLVFTPAALAAVTVTNYVADFNLQGWQTITLDNPATKELNFSTANLAAGRSLNLLIISDANGPYSLYFPAWIWMGDSVPATMASSKSARLTLESWSTTDATVRAFWSVSP